MFSIFKNLFGSHDIEQLNPIDLLNLDPETYVIVDVREQWELDIASLPGAIHIPLGQIYNKMSTLDKDKKTILMCHHGGRSQRAAITLASQGFTNIANLTGGIDQWATTIDSTLRRY